MSAHDYAIGRQTMTATPHEHTSEPGTGNCLICYGEGFVRAATLADEIFTKVEKSISELAQEFRMMRADVAARLEILKGPNG
jgi:hypothetical protein